MTKKELKTLSIVICLFAIITLVIYSISNYYETKNHFYDATIVVDGYAYWKYQNTAWKKIDNTKDYDWKNFNIYTNNTFINKYAFVNTNNKFYFFDSNRDSHNIESPFLAITEQSHLQPIAFAEGEFTDNDNNNIKDYLKSQKINYNGEYSLKKKYTAVFNEKNLSIYLLSNQLYSNDEIYTVFINYNNKNIPVYKNIKNQEIERLDIGWILNTTVNEMPTLILKKEYMESYEYYLYDYNKKSGYSKKL